MKGKKLFLVFVMMVSVMVSAVCYAQISKEDLNIGGIYFGQPMSDVINKLGAPVRRISTPPAGSAPVFRYGNNEIGVRGSEKSPVRGVWVVTGNGDGLFTSRGITVGSTYDEVIKAYGKADSDSFITHPNVQHHSLLYYVPNTNPKDSKAKGVLIFDMSSEKKVIHVSFAEWGENY